MASPVLIDTDPGIDDALALLLAWSSPEISVIIDQARRSQRLLTLVALGPLTNLALTLKADAGAVSLIGRIVAMGGAVDVPGNVTPTAEFNMYVDPEAAHRVLAARLPLH